MSVSPLFSPLTIRSVTLRNRIGVSPMCQYWAEDGFPTDWQLVHLGSRAVGGAGLVMSEATAVEPRGRITKNCTGIWSDAHIEPWARVTRFIKQYGAVPGMQIAHGGRKASAARPWEGDRHLTDDQGGWQPIGPSPIAFGGDNNRLWRVPAEMSVADIAATTELFVAAARRALAAGFDWLELHYAHGYLAHSFLSPLSNTRTDQYGGSLANRMRFAVDTARAVRAVWPADKPLAARLSTTDWAEGGWDVADSVMLARALKEVGVDLIDCSSGGGTEKAHYPVGPGFQVPNCERIRREANVPTAAVGKITDPAQADQIIRTNQADLVFLATQIMDDPYWPLHAARALRQLPNITMPPPYDYVIRAQTRK
jgi:2,4-dienoyl-CoA reductase-like NADH-dependent reductase (Old Yellow Enzyme family)